MKIKSFVIALSLLSIPALAQFKFPNYISNAKQFKLAARLTENDYLPKTIIIKVNPVYRSLCSNYSIQNAMLNELLQEIGASDLKKKFPNHKAPAEIYNKLGQKYADLSLIYEFHYSAKLSVETVANKLLKLGILDFAEPHYLPKFSYQPNDPMATITGQYHLNKIKAYTAWDITHGDTNIVIGITDSGNEPLHPDLIGNIKYNYNDPIDGIDNDGDSLIDNFSGWDVGMNDNNTTWQSNPHGVHVSGLASASTDNLVGVAGVGFNCKFLPVKISDASGALIAAYEGIVYAADHGCSIINCSWGSSGGSSFGQTIIDYATINKNALVVAAAGNDNVSTDQFPAAYNYVLCVASTTSNDNKSSFSNYGTYIDICAPGSNVNSTYSNGSYTNNSGTSMASPVAAGGAALIKSMFPNYTALQIGEQLKATCDAINASVSGTFAGKLGKGRINLFQGTTNTSTKSVTLTTRFISDANDEVFVGNDTLRISGDFINFLAPLANLNLTLSSTSSDVTVLNPTLAVGAMTTLQMLNNSLNPFLVRINPGALPNSIVPFKLNFTDGNYTFNYFFNVVVNVDYINVTVNDISTSITSKGRIGFNSDGQTDGLGFKYKNSRQLLYEAGLMVGNSNIAVSDMVRGVTAGTGDEDFASTAAVRRDIPSVQSVFDLSGSFDDSNALIPLGIAVNHKAFAWNSVGNTKFVIVKYKLFNTSPTAYNNLFAGIFADWDIDDSTYGSNRAAFDAANKMGYAFYTGANGTYVGIKLLTNTAPVVHYAIDNVSGGAGGVDLNNGGYSEAEKFITLSTNRANAGVAGSGTDIIDVVSTGPLSLAQGDSVVVAFALLAGDDLMDLQNSAGNAQLKYDSLAPLSVKYLSNNLNSATLIYPNPANDLLNLVYFNAEKQSLTIDIVDSYGKLLKQIFTDQLSPGKNQLNLNIEEIPAGVYFIKIRSKNNLEVSKFLKY